MTIDIVKAEIQASIDVKINLLGDDDLMQQVLGLAERCTAALRAGGKIIFCGNGGSFADAQHLSAEFISPFLANLNNFESFHEQNFLIFI